MIKTLRNAFITGLLLLLPLGVTVIVMNFLLEKIGAPSTSFIFWYVPQELREQAWMELLLNGASIIVIALMVAILGILSRYFLGKLVVGLAEKVITSVPFINSVYKTVKQVVDTFSDQKKSAFQRTVLVEFPRKGVYSIGFITSVAEGEVQVKTKEMVVNVFVPTTPNPTSGFLLMVKREEIIDLDMTVGDGMKMIISGGAITPPYPGSTVKIENKTSLE